MAQAGYTPISLYHSATPSAVPTAGNLVNGELAINIADGILYYKDDAGVVQSISGATATYTRTSFTATASQTTFTVTYTVGFVEVFLNGVLLNGTDYTASNGTTIVLATGAALNDIVEVIAYNIVNIGVANSLAGGIASQIPYQTGAGTTAFIANGTAGQVLTSNGTSAPSWQNATSLASPLTVTGNSTAGAEIRLPEDTDNGSSYAAIKAPDSLAANRTFTLPDPESDATLGYLNIPQNSQSTAYTLVASDSGKHILHPSADTTARTFTIPANSSVAFPIGTAVTFINQNGAGVITIAITSDTMRLAGAGTTGNRTLAANGVATAIKITSTEWIISGTGLT